MSTTLCLISNGLRGSWIQRAAASQQTQLAVKRAQQHHTGIAGHAAAVKPALYDASAKMSKFDLACSNFFGTVWHWQSFVVIGVRYQ
jgi:hypothetical protein